MRIIAEAGPCNGRLDYAIHAAVRAAQAGAWGFKVQMYQADTLVTPTAITYDYGLDTPPTQAESFAHTIYPYTEWGKVKSVCDDLNIEFFASCWDLEAVDTADGLGVNYFKIGSADITHRLLIEATAATKKQIILSTGAATLDEIRAAVGWIVATNPTRRPILMACSLAYPTHPEEANVSRMLALRTEFPGFEVGYSDHTRQPETIWVAAALGANYVEKHFTVEPGTGGDHNFAVTQKELFYMVEAGQMARSMLGDPVLRPTEAELPALVHARRSIYAAVDIPAGTTLEPHMLVYLRPGVGLPPSAAYDLLGIRPDSQVGGRAMRAMVDIAAGDLITGPMAGHVGASLTVE